MSGGNAARTLTPHHSTTNSHNMTTSQNGGKKKKQVKTKKRRGRSKKGSGHCDGSQKGGLGLGGIIREAMVPFGLLFFQKSLSKKKSANKDKRKTRRFRRR